jgi:hypothetical protein
MIRNKGYLIFILMAHCKKVEGEYTEFVLKFPKVEEGLITD